MLVLPEILVYFKTWAMLCHMKHFTSIVLRQEPDFVKCSLCICLKYFIFYHLYQTEQVKLCCSYKQLLSQCYYTMKLQFFIHTYTYRSGQLPKAAVPPCFRFLGYIRLKVTAYVGFNGHQKRGETQRPQHQPLNVSAWK